MPSSWVTMSSSLPKTINEGNSERVNITVTVPPYTYAGNYSGRILINSDNLPTRTVNLNITVPANISWLNTTTVKNIELRNGATGELIEVVINNTGNVDRNFTITYNFGPFGL